MYHKYVVVSSKKRSIKWHLLFQLFLHVKFLGILGGGIGNLVVNQEIILLRELIADLKQSVFEHQILSHFTGLHVVWQFCEEASKKSRIKIFKCTCRALVVPLAPPCR